MLRVTDSCMDTGFHCPTARKCIPASFKCDVDKDCPEDGADEAGCRMLRSLIYLLK
jgi:hypothetical protein